MYTISQRTTNFCFLSTKLIRWTHAASGAAGRANVGLCAASSCFLIYKFIDILKLAAAVVTRRPAGRMPPDEQCRINNVADVANATGLRPQGGLRK